MYRVGLYVYCVGMDVMVHIHIHLGLLYLGHTLVLK